MPGVSSASGLKRAHGDSIVNGHKEQPGTRARISALIAGLHGVNAAEHDKIGSGDGNTDEWLSSWYPQKTQKCQKMVIEENRKEMERVKRMKVYRVVTRESMERDEEGMMISFKWAITNKGTEEHPIAKARLVAREFNTGDKRGEEFAGTPGLIAMRTVISRAMTRCENVAKRSIMLADVKTAFLCGDARRSLYVELPPDDLLAASDRYVGKLERAPVWTSRRPDDLAGPSPEDTT